MANTIKPGKKPCTHGEYTESGPRGGNIPHPRVVTIKPGKTTFPPTQKKNHTWVKK